MGAINGSLVAKELPSCRIASDVWIAFIVTSSLVSMCQAGSETTVAASVQKQSVSHMIAVPG